MTSTEANIWPQLTRFYGLGFVELWHLPRSVIRLYAEAMPGLIAQEQLLALEVEAYPHLKQQDARTLVRKLERQARTFTGNESQAPQPFDPAALEAIGIKVEGLNSA